MSLSSFPPDETQLPRWTDGLSDSVLAHFTTSRGSHILGGKGSSGGREGPRLSTRSVKLEVGRFVSSLILARV